MTISNEQASDQQAENANENRIAQLETKFAFIEHTVDVLAGELEAQQGETRILHKRLERLQQQLEGLQQDTGLGDQGDEPPPHY